MDNLASLVIAFVRRCRYLCVSRLRRGEGLDRELDISAHPDMDTVRAEQMLRHVNPMSPSWIKFCVGYALALTLSSCVYVPVIDEPDAASASCKTYTKSMSLDTIEIHGNITAQSGCNRGDCAAVALASVVVVTAGSALISGSIVLTGNTLHWLEYQGTCSDGYLSKAKKLFLASIGQATSVETSEHGK